MIVSGERNAEMSHTLTNTPTEKGSRDRVPDVEALFVSFPSLVVVLCRC